MSAIRILLVDDHAVLRAGLRALLSRFADLQVVGEAGDGAEALARVNELKPDVVVMDIAMPGTNGLVATRQILHVHPQTKILILSQYDNKEYVLPLLKMGAASYVLKQSVDTDLVNAIYAVARGESSLGPPVAKIVLDAYLHESSANPEDPYQSLTEREREVLILVAQGTTTAQIAAQLNISPNTVNVHRANLMQKLDLHNVAEMAAYAIRHGLIANPPLGN
ncbi:MAG: response regulator transcription factor [Chloroflexi bacterium]|nr:response regulator transcription factor [Chloroflexota bacterium]